MTFISIRPDFLSTTRFLRSLALVNSLLMALARSACSNFNAGAGTMSDLPDLQNPPRLFRAGGANQLEWDRPAAFGRFPSHLQARGNTICGILGQDVVALGYNPNALDQNGKQIPWGWLLLRPRLTRARHFFGSFAAVSDMKNCYTCSDYGFLKPVILRSPLGLLKLPAHYSSIH